MSDNEQPKEESGGFLKWMLRIIGSALVIYLSAFALLVLFPGAHQAARGIGLSADALEKIFYPIIWLLGR